MTLSLGLDTFGDVTLGADGRLLPQGSLYAGSPETVARKIAATVSALGLGRFDLKYSNGAMPQAQMMESIRLYGTRVIPMVREILAAKAA